MRPTRPSEVVTYQSVQQRTQDMVEASEVNPYEKSSDDPTLLQMLSESMIQLEEKTQLAEEL